VKYQYPQVQGGYRWNMIQRCKNEVGIEPISSGDFQLDGVWQTYLEFSRDLTEVEKGKLDVLMTSNPTYPPSGTKRFSLDDIWEKLQSFNTAAGTSFKLYYNESTPGSGIIDTLELHASAPLTTAQKNKAKTAFTSLIKES
jgi:hypothetical protein